MIVRLKGVKKVRSKGRTYYYHRRSMTRLPGQPSSPEFVQALSLLNKTSTTSSTAHGILGSLLSSYRSSPEFAGLAPATRQKYTKVFNELKPLDDMPLVAVTSEFLYAWRDKKEVERKRAFTNLSLAVLQRVFSWGMKRQKCKTNPAASVEKIRRPRTAPVVNRPWRPEELETVLAAAPEWLRVPIALAAYTGLSEADVMRAEWGWYDGRVISTERQKTGVPIWVPVLLPLRAVLDTAPRCHDRIVVGVRGRPVGRSTMTTVFFGLLKRLREEKKVGAGLSFHGLRHMVGTAIIEAGGTRAMAKAVLAHETEQSSEHYSRTADRRRLATEAMALLENQTENRNINR
jgi:integrase